MRLLRTLVCTLYLSGSLCNPINAQAPPGGGPPDYLNQCHEGEWIEVAGHYCPRDQYCVTNQEFEADCSATINAVSCATGGMTSHVQWERRAAFGDCEVGQEDPSVDPSASFCPKCSGLLVCAQGQGYSSATCQEGDETCVVIRRIGGNKCVSQFDVNEILEP